MGRKLSRAADPYLGEVVFGRDFSAIPDDVDAGRFGGSVSPPLADFFDAFVVVPYGTVIRADGGKELIESNVDVGEGLTQLPDAILFVLGLRGHEDTLPRLAR